MTQVDSPGRVTASDGVRAGGQGGGPSKARAPLFRRVTGRLLLVALLAAAPVTGYTLWHDVEMQRDTIARITGNGLSLAHALAAQHRLAVAEGRRVLSALAAAPDRLGTIGHCDGATMAGGALARPALLTGVTRYAADLTIMCTDDGPGRDAAFRALRLAADRAGAGKTFVAGPAIAAAPSDPRPLVPLALPAADGGVVAALLDPAWLGPGLETLLPSESRTFVVADGTGRVVATIPRQPALVGTTLDIPPFTGSGETGAMPLMLDGRPMLLALAPPDGGLAVGVALDRAAVADAANAALEHSTAVAILALLVGLLAAWAAARCMIGRPVGRLAALTEVLVRDGTPIRLGPPYAGTAELGAVERALDMLGERLSRHEAALISSETQLSVKRQSEERFRALVELAPEAIVVEARGTVLYANSRAVDLFGADGMDDLLAVPLIDQVHPDDREDCRQRLRDARSEGTVGVTEVRLRRFDGGELVAEVVVGPVVYGGRPATHIMIRDVTGSRLARRLRESEERFRVLVESSPDLILAHDRGHIVVANGRAARVLFGEASGEAVAGRSILDIVDGADRAAAIARIQAFGKDPRPLPLVEMAVKCADGGRIICEVVTAPISFEGRLCLHTVLHDVTARRAEQACVAQSAKLATLGELAAGMAHELAQPMNIIRMAAEAALLGLDNAEQRDDAVPSPSPAPAPTTERARLELIATQAGRMGEIIDHMRVFTRRDSGPEERFDAVEATRGALAMIDHGLRGEGITVETDLAGPGTACVSGRPVQLEQVVLNLLTNARDAVLERLHAGDAAEDWRPVIRVACLFTEDDVVIRVADSGMGVPEALRERLFDPFVTSKEAGIGTGLGLSISDGLIRAMGGRISLEVPPAGGGVVFMVTLPRDRRPNAPCVAASGPPRGATVEREPDTATTAPPPPAPGDAAAVPDGDGAAREMGEAEDDEASALVAHVLVADDEREAANLMADYLRARGHRVSVAHNGLAATDIFMDDPADVLITDLRMPGCDGRNLIATLRRHVPDLPVVVVTGHVGAREARGLEADDKVAAVLRKPTSLQHVADLVDTLFAEST